MSEEVKAEEVKAEEQAVVAETIVLPPSAPKKTPQELNKETQGERKTTKKKINRFTREECIEELKRMERKTGHKNSKYYADVKSRLLRL